MRLVKHIGGRESNTFISLAEMSTFLSEIYTDVEREAWDDLEVSQQVHRLVMGATVMGMLPLRGRKIYVGQALCFPRSIQKNPKRIPEDIKRAQAEITYSVVHRAMVSREGVADGEVSNQKVASVSLGGGSG